MCGGASGGAGCGGALATRYAYITRLLGRSKWTRFVLERIERSAAATVVVEAQCIAARPRGESGNGGGMVSLSLRLRKERKENLTLL